MNRKQLKEILNELKNEFKISDPIKIELKPMKTKAASVSLSKSIIRINKNIIPNLDTECLKYLILHELIHYKLKSTYHNGLFHKELNRKISETEANTQNTFTNKLHLIKTENFKCMFTHRKNYMNINVKGKRGL